MYSKQCVVKQIFDLEEMFRDLKRAINHPNFSVRSGRSLSLLAELLNADL